MSDLHREDSLESRRAIAVVCFSVFLDLFGFGITIPVQPFLALSLGASPSVVIGLATSYSLAQFVFAPFWGRLSDKIGRRPVMLVSLALSTIGYLVFGLSSSLFMLFAARFLSGFGSANVGTVPAILIDLTTARTRARAMGWMGACAGLGLLAGPALGGIVAQTSFRAPALMAAALCALNLILAWYLLPETHAAGARPTEAFYAQMRRHLGHREFRLLFVIFALSTMANAMLEQVFGLFIRSSWLPVFSPGLDPAALDKTAAGFTALVYLAIGVAVVAIQGAFLGPLVRRMGERRLLVGGTLLTALGFTLLPLTPTPGLVLWLSVAAVILLAIGMSVATPCLNAMFSKTLAPDARGGTMGAGQSLGALSRMVGPAIAAALYGYSGLLPLWAAAAAVWAAVALAMGIDGEEET